MKNIDYTELTKYFDKDNYIALSNFTFNDIRLKLKNHKSLEYIGIQNVYEKIIEDLEDSVIFFCCFGMKLCHSGICLKLAADNKLLPILSVFSPNKDLIKSVILNTPRIIFVVAPKLFANNDARNKANWLCDNDR